MSENKEVLTTDAAGASPGEADASVPGAPPKPASDADTSVVQAPATLEAANAGAAESDPAADTPGVDPGDTAQPVGANTQDSAMADAAPTPDLGTAPAPDATAAVSSTETSESVQAPAEACVSDQPPEVTAMDTGPDAAAPAAAATGAASTDADQSTTTAAGAQQNTTKCTCRPCSVAYPNGCTRSVPPGRTQCWPCHGGRCQTKKRLRELDIPRDARGAMILENVPSGMFDNLPPELPDRERPSGEAEASGADGGGSESVRPVPRPDAAAKSYSAADDADKGRKKWNMDDDSQLLLAANKHSSRTTGGALTMLGTINWDGVEREMGDRTVMAIKNRFYLISRNARTASWDSIPVLGRGMRVHSGVTIGEYDIVPPLKDAARNAERVARLQRQDIALLNALRPCCAVEDDGRRPDHDDTTHRACKVLGISPPCYTVVDEGVRRLVVDAEQHVSVLLVFALPKATEKASAPTKDDGSGRLLRHSWEVRLTDTARAQATTFKTVLVPESQVSIKREAEAEAGAEGEAPAATESKPNTDAGAEAPGVSGSTADAEGEAPAAKESKPNAGADVGAKPPDASESTPKAELDAGAEDEALWEEVAVTFHKEGPVGIDVHHEPGITPVVVTGFTGDPDLLKVIQDGGVKDGMRIVSLNGRNISSFNSYTDVIRATRAQRPLHVVFRGWKDGRKPEEDEGGNPVFEYDELPTDERLGGDALAEVVARVSVGEDPCVNAELDDPLKELMRLGMIYEARVPKSDEGFCLNISSSAPFVDVVEFRDLEDGSKCVAQQRGQINLHDAIVGVRGLWVGDSPFLTADTDFDMEGDQDSDACHFEWVVEHLKHAPDGKECMFHFALGKRRADVLNAIRMRMADLASISDRCDIRQRADGSWVIHAHASCKGGRRTLCAGPWIRRADAEVARTYICCMSTFGLSDSSISIGEKLPPLRAPANRGPVAPRGSRALGTRAAKKAEPRPTYTEFTKRQEAQLTAQLLLLRFLGEGGDFGSIPPSKLLGDAMNTAIEARASQNNTARKYEQNRRIAAIEKKKIKERSRKKGKKKQKNQDDDDDFRGFVSKSKRNRDGETRRSGRNRGKARKVYAEMDEDDESWMRPDEAEIHEAAAPKTLVDKILGVREHRNRRLEVQRSRRSVYEDVDGEFGGLEFLVKWNERALMHTEWVPSAMIEADGTQSMLKMRRFLRDHPNMLSAGESGVEYFDPIMTEADRVLEAQDQELQFEREGVPQPHIDTPVEIFWDETGEWVRGRVVSYMERGFNKHSIKYDDKGFNEWLSLQYMTDSWRYCVTEEDRVSIVQKDAAEDEDEDEEAEERAKRREPVTRAGRQYHVKWALRSYSDCTWEWEWNLNNDRKIAQFHRFNYAPNIHTAAPLMIRDQEPYADKHSNRPPPESYAKYPESPFYLGGNKLRDYQLEGLNWLIFSWYQRRNVILADEMGLGKTIQSVTLLEHLRTRLSCRGPFLVLAPLSTLDQWKSEIERWTAMNAVIYHDSEGGAETRQFIQDHEWYFKSAKNAQTLMQKGVFKFNVLLTSYNIAMSDAAVLSQIQWRYCIIDEAHRLKNTQSKLMRCLEGYRFDAKLLMTGTPLQNGMEELWSLLNFNDPSSFPSLMDFINKYGALETKEQIEQLHDELKPYMLRRVKGDVAKSIPPTEETIVDIELTTLQKKYYRAIFERNRSFLNQGVGGTSNVANLVNIEMELRKCCNHPFLIKGLEEKETASLSDEDRFGRLIACSGKMVFLDKLLRKLQDDGKKVLIFSQFKIMLDLLEELLHAREYVYERLDGSVSGNTRQRAIDRFNKEGSEHFAFLLSTRAGGLGLNLQSATVVVIFDSDWNPQNDMQAIARCHRLGQTRKVDIYRMVTKNTYEAQMFRRASMKLGTHKAVFETGGMSSQFDEGGDLGSRSLTDLASLDKSEIETMLRYGAYAVMGDDEGASQTFMEADVDDLLAKSKVIQHETGDGGDGTGAGTDGTLNEKGAAKALSFSKVTFEAAEADGAVDLNDESFWEKVLGPKMVEQLRRDVHDGVLATGSNEAVGDFFSNLHELVEAVIESRQKGTTHADAEHVMDILHQVQGSGATRGSVPGYEVNQRDLAKQWLKDIDRPVRRRKAVAQTQDLNFLDEETEDWRPAAKKSRRASRGGRKSTTPKASARRKRGAGTSRATEAGESALVKRSRLRREQPQEDYVSGIRVRISVEEVESCWDGKMRKRYMMGGVRSDIPRVQELIAATNVVSSRSLVAAPRQERKSRGRSAATSSADDAGENTGAGAAAAPAPSRFHSDNVFVTDISKVWCSVCYTDTSWDTDVLVQCDGCGMSVHQYCYGIPQVPPDGEPWYCSLCKTGLNQAKDGPPKCALCPVQAPGAFKPTNDGRWAHMMCALWCPEVAWDIVARDTMEPVSHIEDVPQDRWDLACEICGGDGCCVQCFHPKCTRAFHPICGRNEGMKMFLSQQGLVLLCDKHTDFPVE